MTDHQVQLSNADLSPFFARVFSVQYELVFGVSPDAARKFPLQWCIEVSGEVVAALSAERNRQSLQIKELAVAPAYHGQGLGSQLLNHVKAYAQTEGVLTIHLTTRSYQAKDFYLQHGFKPFGLLENMPWQGVNTHYMVYHL